MGAGVEIRVATADDRPSVEAVVAVAFDEPVDGRTVGMLRGLDETGATRASLVAVDGDEVVGHVQLSRSWIDAREALVEVLVLSPLSVRPDRQGQGVGTALVAAALDRAARLGAPAVFLEGDWDYYGTRGFGSATSRGFTPPSPRIPGPAFQVALLEAYEAWMSGPLVYCEAFWAHDCVGLRDPRLAQIEARAAHEQAGDVAARTGTVTR